MRCGPGLIGLARPYLLWRLRLAPAVSSCSLLRSRGGTGGAAGGGGPPAALLLLLVAAPGPVAVAPVNAARSSAAALRDVWTRNLHAQARGHAPLSRWMECLFAATRLSPMKANLCTGDGVRGGTVVKPRRLVERLTWAYRHRRSSQRPSLHRCCLARLSGVRVDVGTPARARPSAAGRLSVGKGRASRARALRCHSQTSYYRHAHTALAPRHHRQLYHRPYEGTADLP